MVKAYFDNSLRVVLQDEVYYVFPKGSKYYYCWTQKTFTSYRSLFMLFNINDNDNISYKLYQKELENYHCFYDTCKFPFK